MRYLRLSGLLTAAAISACSGAPSAPSKPQSATTFITHIDAAGSKLFVFSLQSPQVNGSSKHARSGMRHGGQGSTNTDNQSAPANDMQQKFNDLLQAKLTDSGFCRDGYIEQDRTVESGFMSLRGQCRDKATPEDRARFKNIDD